MKTDSERPTGAGVPLALTNPPYKLAGMAVCRILPGYYSRAGRHVLASSLAPSSIPATVCPLESSLAGVSECCSPLKFRRSE
jgi:hypothetical protein